MDKMQNNAIHSARLSERGFISGPLMAALLTVVILALLIWALRSDPATTQQPTKLVLYCAAGLKQPVENALAEYQKLYPNVLIQLQPSSSGKLIGQILATNAAVGDLFLPAEEWYLDQLKAKGQLAESIPIASHFPVLAVAKGNPKKVVSLEDLLRDEVRVALPDPGAAIGRTLKEYFTTTGLWPKLEARMAKDARVSLHGTVNEAASAVKLGTADVGIVWLEISRQFDLEAVRLGEFDQLRRRVSIGVLGPCTQPTRALHLARFLAARDKGGALFAMAHMETIPDADTWADVPSITLMAGSMLKPVFDPVLAEFEAREGVRVQTIYNGCGILVAQMKTGPLGMPEAYYACDASFMAEVADKFESPMTLSRNPMVIIVKPGNPLKISTPADLVKPGIRIGLGHPENSALGALTDRLYKQANLLEALYTPPGRVIHADSGHLLVNQMRTGSLDAAIVYRSNALTSPTAAKDYQVIPIADPLATATQPLAIQKNSSNKQLLQRLMLRLKTASSRQRFIDMGFEWTAPQP